MSGSLDKDKIVVIHFQPVELYPPAMNLVNYLGNSLIKIVLLISNSSDKHLKLKPFSSQSTNIDVIRPTFISKFILLRYFNYLKFYIVSLFYLLYYRPSIVIYLESISSFPAILYKKIFSRVHIIAHYHEYTSPAEYNSGMKIVKWMHGLEKKIYSQYDWISHTNAERLKKFIFDNNLQSLSQTLFHSMPNYPLSTWIKKNKSNEFSKLNLVYAGSLGLESSYLSEILVWVQENSQHVTLDIYSFNIKKTALDLILKCNKDVVRYKGYVDYESLPEVLINYNTGIVLYKPSTENFQYNIPNKIFEYLSCGLYVIIPDTMNYARESMQLRSNPKLISLDFSNLQQYNPMNLFSDNKTSETNECFYAELVYAEMLIFLKKLDQTYND